jgi:hypothetical protein
MASVRRSSGSAPPPDPHGESALLLLTSPTHRRRYERLAIRNQIAGVGLVLVLLAVSAFAVIASQLTSHAASSAVAASGLSDDYATTATAVAGEESLERKYRLEPGPLSRSATTRPPPASSQH